MADDPEVNKLEFNDLPEPVLQAMREEHERFKTEQRTFGPHVVSNETYKPRLRAVRERAMAEYQQKQGKVDGGNAAWYNI